ncbi:MAG: hypothetical protein K6A43_07545, partial [Treponema sp.]|nr:hypothetical protein [Treponema sp.]
IMILTFRINGIILSGFNFDLRNVFEFMKWIWVNSAYYFVIILIYNLGSYFALKFKLNLE